jgi:hypothetical protein
MAGPAGESYPWLMDLLLSAIGIQSGYVLAAITLFALPIAAVAFARSGPAWRGIGKGRFGLEHRLPPPRIGGGAPPVDPAIQAAEARQMLEAKSYRRKRRGEAPLDVEAEMTRLLDSPRVAAPDIDERLRDEVRQLVVVRNERRMRSGREPLDVEAETKRQLADLIGLGE